MKLPGQKTYDMTGHTNIVLARAKQSNMKYFLKQFIIA